MSERYRILSINDKPQLQTGIPVLLSTYAISEDTITGKVIAQLKFQNIGEKPITAVYAVLTCYDAMSSLIEDEPEAKYLDMDVASGDFFGDRVPVVLPDNSIRSFDVRIPSIRFEDGTIVKAEENTAFNTINDPGLSLTEGQIKQLEIEAKDRWLVPFSVSPAKLGGKIRCGCSQWNDENVEHCVRCESDLNWLFEHSDPEVLQEHLEERLKEEALREAERQREEEEKQELEKKKAEELRIEQEKADKEHAERIVAEEKKRKKRNRIIIGAVSAAIVAALVYGLAIKPKIDTKNKYKAALALLDEKKYEDAAAEFEELGSYEDSENLLSRVKADQLYDAGKFSNAYEIYKELPAEYQIHENDYQSKYSEAENLLSKGEFEKAAKLFDDIRGYSDSAEKVDTVYYSEAETAYDEGDFAGAKDKFQKLGEYKDSASRAKQAEADGLYTDGDYTAACEIYAGLEEAYRTHEDDYAAMYDNAVALMEKEDYVAAADAFAVIESYSDSADHIPEAYYKAGEKALSLYDFETAKKMYGNAGKYQDSSEKITAVGNYEKGLDFQKKGSFIEAAEAFGEAGILDSEERKEACYEEVYGNASALMEAEDLKGAYDMFSTIEEYKDSAEIVQELEDTYKRATEYEEEGNFDDAILMYSSLKNYSDASQKVKSVAYKRAERLLEEENYDKAAEAFDTLGGYEDSADRVKEVHYKKAGSLEDKGEKILAAEEYAICGDYLDSAEKVKVLSRSIADEAFDAGDYGTALEHYINLEQTDELKGREYELAQTCFDLGYFEAAVKAYEALGEYELSVARLPIARYAWAKQLQENGQYAEAAEQFGQLTDMSDSEDRALQCSYLSGKQLMEEEKYDKAIKNFENLEGYSNADEMITECTYRQALGYLNDEDYETAQSVFEELGDYGDSAEKVKVCIYERGNLKYNKADYEGAWRLYKAIEGYEDTDELILECDYQRALADYNSGDYEAALSAFQIIGAYKDSADLQIKCHFEHGYDLLREGEADQAVRELYIAKSLPEAQELLYEAGKDYAVTSRNEQAIETLWACGDYEPAKTLLKDLGGLLIQNDLKEDGEIAYLASGDRESESQIMLTETELEGPLSKYTLLGSDDFKNAIITELKAFQQDKIAEYLENEEYDKAYAIMEANGESHAVADSKYERAVELQNAGDTEAADKLFSEAYAIMEANGEGKAVADSMYNRAVELQNAGDTEAADKLFSEAYAIMEANGESKAVADSMYNRAVELQNAGDTEAADKLFSGAYAIMEANGEGKAAADSMYNRAMELQNAGDTEAADKWFSEAYAVMEKNGESQAVADSMYNRAVELQNAGDTEAADKLFGKAYDVMRANGNYGAVADSKYERAVELQNAGDTEAADKLIGEAFYEYLQQPDGAEKAKELLSNTGVWVKTGGGYQVKVPSGYYILEEYDKDDKSRHQIFLKNDVDSIKIGVETSYFSEEDIKKTIDEELKKESTAEKKTINNIEVVTEYVEQRMYRMLCPVPEKGMLLNVMVYTAASGESGSEYMKNLSDIVFGTLADENDQILYDNANCYAAVYDVQSGDLSKELKVSFLLENRTSKSLNFIIEEAFINGIEISPAWATKVLKTESSYSTLDLQGSMELKTGELSYSSITWSGADLKENGIEKIDQIELLFKVIDSDGTAKHTDRLYIAP